MDISYETLKNIADNIEQDSFYILDTERFSKNYDELLLEFTKVYPKSKIAYSYKTNYIPRLCEIINNKNGYAEIVSEMELYLAQKIGVDEKNIYYNGPYKKEDVVEKFLIDGGRLNIDAAYEIDIVRRVAQKYRNRTFNVGVRCNIDIGQDFPSRFGFDVESGELKCAINDLNSIANVEVKGLHCHIPYRDIDSYRKRVVQMNIILDSFYGIEWEYISMGGGYMGKMDGEFAKQLSHMPPSYQEYAEIVAGFMKRRYGNSQKQPTLIIEPGTALVANAMQYVTKVINIKKARDKYIATLSGSTYQINPSVKNINRPIKVYYDNFKTRDAFSELYMAGYTCIEGDYLYKNYTGLLSVDDYVVFHNIGSYSIVMKPPFILPDIAVIEINGNGKFCVIKNTQHAEEVFEKYGIN